MGAHKTKTDENLRAKDAEPKLLATKAVVIVVLGGGQPLLCGV